MTTSATQQRPALPRVFDLIMRVSQSRQAALTLILAGTFCAIGIYLVLTRHGGSIETVYWLLNTSLVVLLLLGSVVARQVVRLWQKRKSGAAGSRLHIRLATVFGLLAAVPAVLTAVFASVFFFFGVQSWFDERVSTAVNESLSVAKAYLNEHQQVMRADALAMANDISREYSDLNDNPEAFAKIMRTQSYLRNLPEAIVFRANGDVIATSGMSFALETDRLSPDKLKAAANGEVVLMTSGGMDRIRALVRLERFLDAYLYVGRLVDADVLQHISTAEAAVSEYTALDGKKARLQMAITGMFLAAALLMMMGAVWFGLVFSERLAGPLGALIFAAERIRGGNLSARVQEQPVDRDGGDDEISLLGRAFNRMTEQLESQQKELLSANRLLDERRRFSEAVLAGASSGVVGIDLDGTVTLANARAEEILLGENANTVLVGQKFDYFIPKDSTFPLQLDYTLASGLKRTLLIRITAEQGGAGAVATIDDISALVSAQRSAAWSDVARRIAHEIKNPLTPIQLSAERLRRKYLPQISDDPDTFAKCVDTIVRQVADIGRLVGEFSSYARMPTPVKKPEDIIDICRDALELQKQAYSDIAFEFIFPPQVMKFVNCDRGQVSQVMNNLLKNGIDSIHERILSQPEPKGRVIVTIESDGERTIVSVEDNGTGLPDEKVSDQLFEPYVTTKKKGSGLGLAIVRKIMDDHSGSVSIENVMTQGVKTGAKAAIVFVNGK
jgi:two-component system nitrogen regulation sensor histidine kinase NtrY